MWPSDEKRLETPVLEDKMKWPLMGPLCLGVIGIYAQSIQCCRCPIFASNFPWMTHVFSLFRSSCRSRIFSGWLRTSDQTQLLFVDLLFWLAEQKLPLCHRFASAVIEPGGIHFRAIYLLILSLAALCVRSRWIRSAYDETERRHGRRGRADATSRSGRRRRRETWQASSSWKYRDQSGWFVQRVCDETRRRRPALPRGIWGEHRSQSVVRWPRITSAGVDSGKTRRFFRTRVRSRNLRNTGSGVASLLRQYQESA